MNVRELEPKIVWNFFEDLNDFKFTKITNKKRLKISNFYKTKISRECFLEDYKKLYE